MEHIGTGAGLAALGFWLFVAAVIAIGVWDNIRRRDAQHETLRRVVESGQAIDDSMVDKLLSITDGVPSRNLQRDLMITFAIFMGLAPGLLAMGYIMSLTLAEELLYVMLGVSALMLCLGAAFYGAAQIVGRWYLDD